MPPPPIETGDDVNKEQHTHTTHSKTLKQTPDEKKMRKSLDRVVSTLKRCSMIWRETENSEHKNWWRNPTFSERTKNIHRTSSLAGGEETAAVAAEEFVHKRSSGSSSRAVQEIEFLEHFFRDIRPLFMSWRGSDFFGFFPLGFSSMAAVGQFLMNTLVTNPFNYLTGPAAHEISAFCVDFFVDFLTLNTFFDRRKLLGVWLGSSSEAILYALLCARKCVGPKLKLVVSALTHFSVRRLASLFSVPTIVVAVNERGTVPLERLRIACEQHGDLASLMLIATVGTTALANVDFEDTGDLLFKYLHVDGAYGLNFSCLGFHPSGAARLLEKCTSLNLSLNKLFPIGLNSVLFLHKSSVDMVATLVTAQHVDYVDFSLQKQPNTPPSSSSSAISSTPNTGGAVEAATRANFVEYHQADASCEQQQQQHEQQREQQPNLCLKDYHIFLSNDSKFMRVYFFLNAFDANKFVAQLKKHLSNFNCLARIVQTQIPNIRLFSKNLLLLTFFVTNPETGLACTHRTRRFLTFCLTNTDIFMCPCEVAGTSLIRMSLYMGLLKSRNSAQRIAAKLAKAKRDFDSTVDQEV